MAAGRHIAWFDEIGLGDREQVGGKGGSLGELKRAGIAVPPGYVVRTAAFERALESLERKAPVRAAVAALKADDLESITACSRALRRRMEEAELPGEVLEELTTAHASLVRAGTEQPVAVRSSATCEDALDASFAGLQDTYLWVQGTAQVMERVRSCWASRVFRTRTCGSRAQRRSWSACAAAGQACTRCPRSAIASGVGFPKNASQWPSWSRSWWMPARPV